MIVLLMSISRMSAVSFSVDGLLYEVVSEVDKTCKVISNNSAYSGDISIPETANGYTVVELGENAFYKCSSLTSISIPNTIRKVGKYAFSGCTSLTRVNITDLTAWMKIDFYSVDDDYTKSLKSQPLSSTCQLYLNGEVVKHVTVPAEITKLGYRTFAMLSSLESVTLHSGITEIGPQCFSGCTNLQSIEGFPDDAIIGWSAFYNVPAIESMLEVVGNITYLKKTAYSYSGTNDTEIELREGTVNVVANLFYGKYNITTVKLPSSIKKIGCKAFQNCTKLSSLTLQSSPDIEYAGFSGCKAITSISFTSDDEAYIGQKAFEGCSNLTSFTGHVRFLGSHAFSSCSKLATVNIISSSLSEIGPYAFSNCTALSSLQLPSTIKAVGEGAFQKCSSLVSIQLPDEMESIENYCFQNCSSLSSYTGLSSVKSIGKSAFEGCSSLTAFSCPSDVTSIGAKAFKGTGITSFTLPAGLTSIEEGCFQDCGSLSTITVLGNSIVAIGESAFQSTSISSFSLPNPLQEIGRYAFRYCSKLASVSIPGGLPQIPAALFSGCSSLESVVIGSNVSVITYQAFLGCNKLQAIDIPNSVKEIGEKAFYKCSSITSFSFPEGVKWIGSNVLYGCKNLEEVTLPSTVTEIYNSAFKNCSALKSITIPTGVTKIGAGAFGGCKALKSVYISDLSAWCRINFSFDDVNNGANGHGDAGANPLYHATEFYVNGERLTQLVIPDGIEVINDYAFYGFTELTDLKIPSAVKTIGRRAFAECKSLNRIYVKSAEAPQLLGWGNVGVWWPFDKCPLTEIYIPNESIDSYSEKWAGSASWPSGYISHLRPVPFDYMNLSGTQTPRTVSFAKSAFSYLNDTESSPSYIDLSEATFDESITAESLKEGDTGNILYYIPSGSNIIGGNIVVDGATSSFTKNSMEDIIIPTAFSANQVQYIREISKSSSAATSLCLPYDYTLPEGLTAYTLGQEDASGNLVFEKLESGVIEANKPYVVRASQDISNLNATNVTIKKTEKIDAGIDGYQFVGTLSSISIAEAETMGAYILNGENEWVPVSDETGSIKPGTAYLIPTSSTPESIKCVLDNNESSSYVEITISSAGKSTYCGEADLDFSSFGSNLKAFIATGFEPNSGTIWMTRVSDVPAGTGVFLTGTEGTYRVPVRRSTSHYKNMLAGTVTSTSIPSTTDEYTNYYLTKESSTGEVKFCKIAGSGRTMSANRAYLQVPNSIGNRPSTATATSETITISALRKSTYCSENGLDFSKVNGLKAYAVTGYTNQTGTLWMTRVTDVPAGMGIFLAGEPGTYKVPTTTYSESNKQNSYYENMLIGTLVQTDIPSVTETESYFYLTTENGVAKFCRIAGDGRTMSAHKAYLPIPTSALNKTRSVGGVESYSGFGFGETISIGISSDYGDDTTGIEDLQQDHPSEDVFYNLNGQKVDKPGKGLYIKNGKKVFIH